MAAILKWMVTPRSNNPAGAESLTQPDSSGQEAVETPTDQILSKTINQVILYKYSSTRTYQQSHQEHHKNIYFYP